MPAIANVRTASVGGIGGTGIGPYYKVIQISPSLVTATLVLCDYQPVPGTIPAVSFSLYIDYKLAGGTEWVKGGIGLMAPTANVESVRFGFAMYNIGYETKAHAVGTLYIFE